MLILLAPSKTLNFTSPAPEWAVKTLPPFYDEAVRVHAALAQHTDEQLARLYRASSVIVSENRLRLTEWPAHSGKSALWAYRGDVYKGMYADEMTQAEAEWAQQHVVILSGLYGLVRPYDSIAPYRLEMASKLAIDGKNLAAFWSERLGEYVTTHAGGVVCCLSSEEYARPALKHAAVRKITPVFMDTKPNGTVGQVPIYSKMMRGVMARWMIARNVTDPSSMREFSAHGYEYDGERSGDDRPVYTRKVMKPLVF